MTYLCPKGHQSTDSDYCSECGALIGSSKLQNVEPIQSSSSNKPSDVQSKSQEICPDCGTPREGGARFCEVCRHDFQDNKTGIAEVIVAAQKASIPVEDINKPSEETAKKTDATPVTPEEIDDNIISRKLNLIISVDKDKASSWDGESPIKPDSVERVFPLDLDENLVGRRSAKRGIYPEIEINDPGVSHRHLKFIKEASGNFVVLELGSSNGTEINGKVLEPGINTAVKAGDELTIGIWTRLKLAAR